MSPRKSKTDPEIVEMPPQRMAVVSGTGVPAEVFPVLMRALYGSVYTLKFDRKKQGLTTFKVSGLRGRYPDIAPERKADWKITVGLPVPGDIEVLPQKVTGIEVMLEDWEYGTEGQILHLGAYDQE